MGIKVDDPKKVCLQPLIQKIIIRRAEADYFNLFFSQVLDQNFRLLSPVKIKELENIREKILSTPMDPDDQELEKAKEVSTWMEKNKELLQNITYLRLRGLSLKTIPPRVYELLTGLRRIEFC